ncbi:Trp biosynthesis-associated membrane protein [Microbacterium marinilacus]|uniref:Peptidase n=1 Tax=Microbacterium marinilacus TaxID=415209 RepID=A0ABP7B2K7_9MICO|nr:Trp biosynthesis-associated membrane protein [Microbacterium marinilacus]MBY0688718.1 Trp biosynthesis-associated membrane protein [Microbacterium marinilacus]
MTPSGQSRAARMRPLAVVTILAAGAVALIGSTQTWAVARLADGDLDVSGATAIPVLQPLTLTALALGLVLTLVGRVLRYVLGGLAVVVAAVLGWLSAPMVVDPPVASVAAAVAERTGLAGVEAAEAVVSGISPTPWPLVTLAAAAVLAVAGLVVLATAHTWARGGRRFATGTTTAAQEQAGPLDAVDSWDDLSRGDDPTR